MGRFVKEVSDAFWERMGPHGAAEIAHSLYSGSAYVPYGSMTRPLEPEAGMNRDNGYDPSLYAAPAEERDDDLVME